MNKIKGTILLLLTATLYMVAALNGAVGCMDNSQHLKQMYDTKAYHYVKCDCPCRSKAPGSNRCARCKHLRVPQEEEYVTLVAQTRLQNGSGQALQHDSGQAPRLNSGQAPHNTELSSMMQDPGNKLQRLIQEYKRKRVGE